MFARGGTQGGEGATEGESWYIENVLEELDMGREWYVQVCKYFLLFDPFFPLSLSYPARIVIYHLFCAMVSTTSC